MKPGSNKNTLLVLAALCAITIAAYWPVTSAGFVDYDDNDYVTENLKIQDGLTGAGLVWAFTSSHAANWHPVTWLSHMADIQVYDLRPAGHHVTNLLLHTANVALLFVVLLQMTGAFWRGAIVAALFAVHPSHVESVAWISERKDVLCTLFGLLTVWAYAKHVAGASRERSRFFPYYLLALLFFALGLLSKPMLVTLPFCLLLLDLWPLRRFPAPWHLAALRPLFVEKVPFFALTAASCIVTFLVQHAGGATVSTKELPWVAAPQMSWSPTCATSGNSRGPQILPCFIRARITGPRGRSAVALCCW